MLLGKCKIYSLLAYGMAAYCIASFFYFVRTSSIGTPFKDSLTPNQISIKNESASARKSVFIQGILLAIVLLLWFEPFKGC